MTNLVGFEVLTAVSTKMALQPRRQPSKMTNIIFYEYVLFKNNRLRHFNIGLYRRLYIGFTDHFAIQSQDPMNLCCSLNNLFPINNWIIEKQENSV
jgi:hypothetical protein